MNINDLFPSRYLSGMDLQGPQNVIIDRVITETFKSFKTDADETKPVIYFRGTSKGVIMSHQLAQQIAQIYGQEIEAWLGKPIQIFPLAMQVAGVERMVVRARKAAGVIMTELDGS